MKRPVELIEAHSLAEFQRDAEKYIKRLKKSRRPLLLTVNGQAEVVVQDVKSYQAMLEAIERGETLAAIQRGLAETQEGEGVSARAFLETMRKKHKITP